MLSSRVREWMRTRCAINNQRVVDASATWSRDEAASGPLSNDD